MSFDREFFRFCPRCRGENPHLDGNLFHCRACELRFYQNTATAVAALILNRSDELLVITRAKEPAKGRLAFPGGFVDAGESAENALRREVREEIGLGLDEIGYLGSHPNFYEYRGITYPTVDLFYLCRTFRNIGACDAREVLNPQWVKPESIEPGGMAFPSLQRALEELIARLAAGR